MSSRLNVVVAVTPINAIAAVPNDYAEHEMVDAQVGGSLAGCFEIPLAAMVRVGSLSGYTYSTLARFAGVGGAPVGFAAFDDYQVLFVRHTGKVFGTTSVPGSAATQDSLSVQVGTNVICELAPGQALLLPLAGADIAGAADIVLRGLGLDTVSVEAMILG